MDLEHMILTCSHPIPSPAKVVIWIRAECHSAARPFTSFLEFWNWDIKTVIWKPSWEGHYIQMSNEMTEETWAMDMRATIWEEEGKPIIPGGLAVK